MVYIYLQNWVVNVGKYSIHGAYGIEEPIFLKKQKRNLGVPIFWETSKWWWFNQENRELLGSSGAKQQTLGFHQENNKVVL